jgi:hypothetical protein
MREKGKRRRQLRMRACLGNECVARIKARYPGLCKKCKRIAAESSDHSEEYTVVIP